MLVVPIASTFLHVGDDNPMGYQIHYDGSHGIDQLAEAAGRVCYQSFSRPNPQTATNQGYLKNIIDQGHLSVLGHGSVTFYVDGVSRSLTHELIRHRFLVFSELSQRYVNMEESYTVIPPAFRDDFVAADIIEAHHETAIENYNALVQIAEEKGLSRKQARQAARCVLPGGTNTSLIVTGNIRAWRDCIEQRWSEHADDEIREFAGLVLDELRGFAPNSIQDISDTPYE